MEKIQTRQESDKNKAELLEHYGGYFCGEVYLAARDMFSRYKVLEHTTFRFAHETGEYLFAATPDPENPSVTINTNPEQTLDARMISRLKERFDLSDEVISMAQENPGVIRPLVLAHELAHLLQIDPNFSYTYGEDYVDQYPNPSEDYKGYLMSDPEVSADYIAVSILANTPYGQALGLEMPDAEPADWRHWSQQRPMKQTISLFGSAAAA